MPAQVSADQAAMQRFTDAVRQLGQMSGKHFEAVIRHELGAILTGAIRNTKKATVKSIRENARKRPGILLDSDEYKGPQSRTGKQYSAAERQRLTDRAARRRSEGRMIYYLPGSTQPKRYPNWVWKQIEEKRERQLKERLGARGLAAKMWLHISDQLRLNVQAPGYIRNAKNAKRGDMPGMVATTEGGRGAEYSVGFVNALTKTNPYAKAGLAFRRALNARANYFKKSVELAAKGVIRGVFDRYPNLGRFS
jgi:hypothetical protein